MLSSDDMATALTCSSRLLEGRRVREKTLMCCGLCCADSERVHQASSPRGQSTYVHLALRRCRGIDDPASTRNRHRDAQADVDLTLLPPLLCSLPSSNPTHLQRLDARRVLGSQNYFRRCHSTPQGVLHLEEGHHPPPFTPLACRLTLRSPPPARTRECRSHLLEG